MEQEAAPPFSSVGVVAAVVLGGVIIFHSSSWLLRHRPHILHGRPRPGRLARAGWKDKKSRPVGGEEDREEEADWLGMHRFLVQHLSHRGSSMTEGHMENTVGAFAHAVKSGTELVELDVWLTKDHKVVVFHDKDFQRMCGVEGTIPDTNYADLPPIITQQQQPPTSSSSMNGASNGSSSPPPPPPSSSLSAFSWEIPLLSAVLDAIPVGMPVIVEFKHDHPVLIEEVHGMLTQRGKLPYTIWYSLNHSINSKLRAFDPSLPRITSIRSMARLAFLYTSGLLPFLPHSWAFQEDIYLAFYFELTYERVVRDWRPMADWKRKLILWGKCGPYTIHEGKPCRILVPPGLMGHLRRRGVPTWLVGVNSEQDIQDAAALGATGALTDRPLWLSSLRQQPGNNNRLPLPSLLSAQK